MTFMNSIRRGTTVGVILLGAIALVMVGANQGDAAQRRVMFEEFTSTTCPPCAQLAPILEQVFPQVADISSEVVYHMNWPGAGSDPWNGDNRVDNGANGVQGGRRAYYGVNGVPMMFIDGTLYQGNYSTAAIVAYIQNRRNVASPATMEVTGEFADENTLVVHVDVTAESALNTKLYISLNEQQYHFNAEVDRNWDEHFHPMVKMIPNWQGTAVRLAANASDSYDFELSMEGLGWHELDVTNLELVAFLENDGGGMLQSARYELGITAPSISTVEWSVSDFIEGDGDGRAEPGEISNLYFTIANAAGFLPAESVVLTVGTDDPQISMIQSTFELANLENGAQADNMDFPIRFTVDDAFVPHPVRFTVTTTAQPGDFEAESEIEFMVGWPAFLIIDASNSARATSSIVDLFGVEPLPWCDRWDRTEFGAVPDEMLPNYQVVLWQSFNNQTPINEFEANSLINYLDGGGKLMISGSFVPEVLGDHSLLSNYCGVTVDNPNIGQGFVYGVANDPQFNGCRLFPGGGNGAGTPSRIASFNGIEGTRTVLYFDDGSGNKTGNAAIVHETAVYSTMILGFPVESIGAGAGTEQRRVFVNRVWDWVKANANSVGENPSTTPLQFSMDAAYPNPFNSTTVLSFSLPTAGEATLAIFDVAGREVANLMSGITPAGNQHVAFDATNFGLGAGVYYAKLQAAGQSETVKLLYLK